MFGRFQRRKPPAGQPAAPLQVTAPVLDTALAHFASLNVGRNDVVLRAKLRLATSQDAALALENLLPALIEESVASVGAAPSAPLFAVPPLTAAQTPPSDLPSDHAPSPTGGPTW